jgi:hypothetical protein
MNICLLHEISIFSINRHFDTAMMSNFGRIRFTPPQGGASATVDCAAICRKRVVITGSLLRPQSQQQKVEQLPCFFDAFLKYLNHA